MHMRSLFAVVDDDESLPDLLSVFGFAVQPLKSGEELLASESVEHTNCLILDIVMCRGKCL